MTKKKKSKVLALNEIIDHFEKTVTGDLDKDYGEYSKYMHPDNQTDMIEDTFRPHFEKVYNNFKKKITDSFGDADAQVTDKEKLMDAFNVYMEDALNGFNPNLLGEVKKMIREQGITDKEKIHDLYARVFDSTLGLDRRKDIQGMSGLAKAVSKKGDFNVRKLLQQFRTFTGQGKGSHVGAYMQHISNQAFDKYMSKHKWGFNRKLLSDLKTQKPDTYGEMNEDDSFNFIYTQPEEHIQAHRDFLIEQAGYEENIYDQLGFERKKKKKKSK